MPEFLQSSFRVKDLAETPTDANRILVLNAVRDCEEVSDDPASVAQDGWGYILEHLQNAGTHVPIGELMGALKGL